MLQTDRYYRGYRLSSTAEGVVVWYECDLVEVVDDTATAELHIDQWHNAP